MTSATYQAFSITGDDVTLTETMTNNGHTGKQDLFYFFSIFENAEIEIETEMSKEDPVCQEFDASKTFHG